MKQLSKEQAIAIYKGNKWANWTDEQIVKLQLYQRLLCVPFDRFHQAVENVFCRPVWTHEFANQDRMIAEYEGKSPAPTFQEIVDMIPEEKRIIVVAP